MKGPRRGSRPADPHGVCVVDKPTGWTSHDVVARTRSLLNTPRIGHAGTLDPMATGVLVLGVGKATRLLRYVTDGTKRYEAEITFGVETDSLDADGQVVTTHDMDSLTAEDVMGAAAQFVGEIMQIPPMVSALKVDGQRLHQLARQGIEIEREPRPITVFRFDLLPTENPLVWLADIECSPGTYVRTLAADLGRALGGGAHLSALRRTAVGPFLIGEAQPLEAPILLPVIDALRSLPKVKVDDDLAALIQRGSVFTHDETTMSGEGPWAMVDSDGTVLAVYELFGGGRVKPSMVLAPQGSG